MSAKSPETAFSGHELSAKSGVEIVSLLKNGEVSPDEMIGICLARMEQVEPLVNACPTICEDRAKRSAKSLSGDKDHPGWLAGLPISIKDLSDVSGVRTTYGTKGLGDNVPKISAPIVTRLEARGGVVLAKSNTPEFGAGANTFNDVFGPTLNPRNTSRNAAGSSGGAAACLATGQFWFAHGSDHAGSLRTPAAYCGVVGLRPSPGRVPSGGPPSFSRTGVQGPMARSVEDCACFLDAMAGFEESSPISFPSPAQAFHKTTLLVESNWKIAYSPTLDGYGPVEKDVQNVLSFALREAQKNGAKVDEACPDLTALEATYRTLRGLMWAANLGTAPADITDHLKETLRDNIAFGQSLTIDDVTQAGINRARLFADMTSFLSNYDVLATAVVGCAPKPIAIEYPEEVGGTAMDDYISWLKFAFLSTTTGLPAISVPVGFTPDGLPVGLQLIGPPRGEAKLLQVANFMEKAMNLPLGPIDPIVKIS